MRRVFSPSTVPSSRSSSLFRELVASLCSVIYPTRCSLCGGELSVPDLNAVCPDCWGGLERWEGPLCDRCGAPLASLHVLDSEPVLCGSCRVEEPPFDRARSFGLYTGRLRGALLLLKFQHRDRLGKKLGERLLPVWDSLEELRAPARPLIVPVPLHVSRARERGFNQAEVLARGLVRALSSRGAGPVPDVEEGSLRRTRATAPQTGLSLHERHENVRGVFAVERPEKVRGRVVVLVDDVMTTGATLAACARAVQTAAPAKIVGLTLARATPLFPDHDISGPFLPVDEVGPSWR